MDSSDLTPQDGVSKDSEVGYKNPPKSNQFKKGQSGNPKGRPKHPTTRKEALTRQLSAFVTITENGVQRKKTTFEVLIKKAFALAMSGDSKMLMYVLEMSKDVNLTSILYPRVPEKISPEEQERKDYLDSVVREVLNERYGQNSTTS